MVIDDEQDILDCINLVLSSEGYEVKTLLSPGNLFQQIRRFKPDLITLDIRLYNQNGLEVCKIITSNPDTMRIPVVMISSDQSIYGAVDDYGATDIILKPFSVETFLGTINKHLEASVISLFR